VCGESQGYRAIIPSIIVRVEPVDKLHRALEIFERQVIENGVHIHVAARAGVYVGILVLLSSEARYWEGVGYLILYNLVFILPLLVILLLGTRAETLARIDRWRVQRRRQMKAVGGVFMILLGIATYYGVFLSVTKL